jgi:di/tricarboxylate transporter
VIDNVTFLTVLCHLLFEKMHAVKRIVRSLATKVAPHIYGDHDRIEMTSSEKQGVTATLIILVFLAMIFNVTSPEVSFLIALVVLMLCEILTLSETLAGFSNEALVTIGALYIVIGAVEKSHVVDAVARSAFGTTGSLWISKLKMYVIGFFISCFLNKTPLMALFIPIVKDFARIRGIGVSQVMMPMAFALVAGSFGTIIATSTNLTINGLMLADRGYQFSFFSVLPIGAPTAAILIIYCVVAAPWLLPDNKTGLIRLARDKTSALVSEIYVTADSQFVGSSVSMLCARLGLSTNQIIKIRRNIHNINNGAQLSGEAGKQAPKKEPEHILDPAYWTTTGHFWANVATTATTNMLSTVRRYQSKRNAQSSKSDGASSKSAEGNQSPSKYIELAADGADVEAATTDPEYQDILSPDPLSEVVLAGDVLFVSQAQIVVSKLMKAVAGEAFGLKLLDSNVMDLPGFGSELMEIVLSHTNPFLGKKFGDISKEFSETYEVAIITSRSRCWHLGHGVHAPAHARAAASAKDSPSEESSADVALQETRPSEGIELVQAPVRNGDNTSELPAGAGAGAEATSSKDNDSIANTPSNLATMRNHVLEEGDVLLVLGKKRNLGKLQHNPDFFAVSGVGSVPKPMTLWSLIPTVSFIICLSLVAAKYIDVCAAALAMAAFVCLGGWIKSEEIPKLLDMKVLMLLGCSLSFAKAISTTGLASEIAVSINKNDPSPLGALYLIYGITLMITELITNNAAGALMYPIAVALADEMGLSYKPFAMTVLISATAGFTLPIGYQVWIMIWGPGGYTIRDFIKFGAFCSLMYWAISPLIIKACFPFDE